MPTKLWLENLKRRDPSQDLDVDGNTYNIRMALRGIRWRGVT